MPILQQSGHRVLEGLRVIDYTVMIAGSTAGRLFAELGADVIHVEPPYGDDGRNSTTKFLGSEGTIFTVGNRSKRGIVIDIRNPDGRDLFERLVLAADVFIENTTPGVLEKFGLGYEHLSSVKPDLIQLSVSGWGATGPLSRDPGYEVVIQAYSGAMKQDAPGEVPRGPGILMGDSTGPLLGTVGALAALRRRNQTGEGTHVTSSVLQGALFQMGTHAPLAEDEQSTSASADPLNAPFRAKDGAWVWVAAKRPAAREALGKLVQGQTEAPTAEQAAAWVSARSAAEAVRQLGDMGVPAARVRAGLGDLFRDMAGHDELSTIGVTHPEKGQLWTVGSHFEVDGTSFASRAPAPRLGEHTREVLTEFGLRADEVSRLEESGAVVDLRDSARVAAG